MTEFERILLECRYLLSLNKSYNDLSLIFNVSKNIVYDELNNKLPKLDRMLYKRVKYVLNSRNSS